MIDLILQKNNIMRSKKKKQYAGNFYVMDHGGENFNEIKKVFGTDVKFPEKKR